MLCLDKRAITGTALGILRPELFHVRRANQPLIKLGKESDDNNLTKYIKCHQNCKSKCIARAFGSL